MEFTKIQNFLGKKKKEEEKGSKFEKTQIVFFCAFFVTFIGLCLNCLENTMCFL